jgi:uncharacterized protein YfaS (alpha-2-macroglobulin family)
MAGGGTFTKRAGWIVAALLMIGIAVIMWPRGTVQRPQATSATPGATTAEGAGNFARIVGIVPMSSDSLERQIVFFFDEEIVVPAGADGSSIPALTVSPEVTGEISVGKNYIAYRAQASTVRGGTYTVDLAEGLKTVSGKSIDPAKRHYVFATTPFAANNLYNVSERDTDTVLGVVFSLAVNAETARQHISVKQSDGQAATFKLEPGTAAEILNVVVDNSARWPVTVTTMKGLPDATGAFSVAENSDLTFPADQSLLVARTEWVDVGAHEQVFAIEFSQDVVSTDLEKNLRVVRTADQADVPHTIRTTGPSKSLEVAVTNELQPGASAQLNIAIASGLPGANKTRLDSDFSTSITGYLERLEFENGWWNDSGRDGMAYEFSMSYSVELSEMRAHLTVKPALKNMAVEKTYGRYFLVKGDYDAKSTYTFELGSGLKYGEGGTLAEPLSTSDTTDVIPKYVGFGQEGKYYFPRKPGLKLDIESRNLEKSQVGLHRLFPSNVAVALSALNDGRGSADFIDSWSEHIKDVDVPVAMKKDRLVTTPLDLDTIFPSDKKGAFCLQAKTDEWYGEGTKIVLWTDMGVLAYWQKNGLTLFAHNLYSLEPIAQAQAAVYSTKNQLLGQAETDASGIVLFSDLNVNLGEPRVVVVQKGDDYTFLELQAREDDQKTFTPEMPDYGRDKYDAFVYADRELYRPGETVHLRWLVRTNYGDALPNVPLKLRIVKPSGNELMLQPVTLSDLGGGHFDVKTEKAYPTGQYQASVLVPGSDEPIGNYSFNIEEFVPARIKSTVTLNQNAFVAGKDYAIHVDAQHLFGAPAADRRSEARIIFSRDNVVLDQWKDYVFENDSDYAADSLSLGELTTDANGKATFALNYAAPSKVTFPMQATVVGRVFELGGRAVVGRARALMFPSETALGVRAVARREGGIEVMVAAVMPDQTPANVGKVKVTLERQTWNYYVRRYYSDYEPRWSESFEPQDTQEVSMTNGKGSVTFNVEGYGYYRVRVHSESTPQYSTQSFYAYNGKCNLVDAARPSLIKIALDKDRYTIGEEALVRIESPFDGQGIVVIQGEKLYSMQPVKIVDGVGVVRIPVTEEYFPNVWIEATVIHAVQGGKSQLYPFSSAAMTDLKVTNPARALNVSFPTLPAEVLPHTTMTFEIHVKDASGTPSPAELTLAAVDEGIHLITDYKSPDPISWLSRSRKPDYRRTHYYDKVAYDFEKAAIGGDEELAARAGAAEDSWIKPLALWSGVVRTDETGQAKVTFEIPEFSGQLRLVAVGSTSTGLGASSSNFYVRRPHMQRLGLPRFLLPSDSSEARVVLFNTTDAPVKATVAWTSGGALTDSKDTKTVDVPAKGETNFVVPIAAKDSMGKGTLDWTTTFADAAGTEVGRIDESTPIPVFAPATYQSYNEIAVLDPGESGDFKNTKFVDDERASVALSVSANPLIRLDKSLRYIVGYPYGCVEQTTSRLMPLYLLKQSEDLARAVLPEGTNLQSYITSGINRLFAMQTPEGGLGFWPGSQTPVRYGSVYAFHFLTLAKHGKDFELPETSYKALQNYIRGVAFDESDNSQSGQYTRAYALYTLALDGDLQAIQQLDRFDNVSMPRPARLLLAAALAVSTGDSDRVKLYLQKAPSEPFVVGQFDETFGSDIRNTAVELLMLQQIDPRSEDAVKKANELMAFIDTRYYGSTQESAFIVSALTTYLMSLKTDVATAKATIVEQDKEVLLEGNKLYFGKLEGPSRLFKVTNTGTTPMFVNLILKGVPATPDTGTVSEGMSVTRTMLTADGSELEAASFGQGESFIVRISIDASQELKHVVVTDMLPAGFEIENPRLNPESNPDISLPDAYEPSYRDVRDDRLVAAFDSFPSGKHSFYYIVRAITPGKYQRPGAVAECMYDASFRARSAPETAEIATPK